MSEGIYAMERGGVGEDVFIHSKTNSRDDIRLFEGHPDGIDSRVVIRDKRSGAILFVGKNKTIIPGSEFLAMRAFDIENSSYLTPTYNSQMELDQTQIGTGNDKTLDYKICLFCIGNDGCALGSSIPYEVSKKKWIDPDNLVPFQYVQTNRDLDTTQRGIYFGRKSMTDRGRIAYYFKKFDSVSIVKKQFEDGTPWGASIFSDNSALAANVIVSQTMTVNAEDGRDWFTYTSGINDGRFSSLSLLMAWPTTIGGYTFYQDVRPFSCIHFNNRFLADLSIEFEITYDLYF